MRKDRLKRIYEELKDSAEKLEAGSVEARITMPDGWVMLIKAIHPDSEQLSILDNVNKESEG